MYSEAVVVKAPPKMRLQQCEIKNEMAKERALLSSSRETCHLTLRLSRRESGCINPGTEC